MTVSLPTISLGTLIVTPSAAKVNHTLREIGDGVSGRFLLTRKAVIRIPTSAIAPGNVFATRFCGRVAPQLGAVSRSDTATLRLGRATLDILIKDEGDWRWIDFAGC
jgi:hypothetical protein